MLEEDYNGRLTFCHHFNEKLCNNVSVARISFSSDEATFHISEKVNRRNCRIWGAGKPKETFEDERCQTRSSYVFENRVINGDGYLDILHNYFIPQLERLELKDNSVFQQDRAPCHFALCIKLFLNQEFPKRWI